MSSNIGVSKDGFPFPSNWFTLVVKLVIESNFLFPYLTSEVFIKFIQFQSIPVLRLIFTKSFRHLSTLWYTNLVFTQVDDIKPLLSSTWLIWRLKGLLNHLFRGFRSRFSSLISPSQKGNTNIVNVNKHKRHYVVTTTESTTRIKRGRFWNSHRQSTPFLIVYDGV